MLYPKGGLNDILSMIRMYNILSNKIKRKLIVNFNMNFLFQHFENYAYFINNNFIYKNEDIEKIINDKTTFYPNFVNSNNYNNIVTKYKSNNKCIYVNNDDINYSFELNKNYSEDILVVVSCGRINNNSSLFKTIRFKENFIKQFIEKFKKLPEKYNGVHVRYSDMKSDYNITINNCLKKFTNSDNLYIATDSKMVLDKFKKKFNNVYNFCNYGRLNIPLHLDHSKNDNNIVIVDMFNDILFLLFSDSITSNSMGGFIELINYLYNDKNFIKIKKNEINKYK